MKLENGFAVPETLSDFNLALRALSLRAVTKAELDEVLKTETKSRLVAAINRAHDNPSAMAYLNRWFGRQDAAEQGHRQDTQPLQNEEPETERTYIKHHVYGGKAALCFEADTTRSGVFTVSLDAAEATAPKQYNWGNKIRVQLTRDELLVVTAVLFGMLPRCEYKNHGQDNTKGFSVEDQGDKLFVRVFSKNNGVKAVPVTPEDAFYVAQIFLSQMKKNAPWLEAGEIMATLRQVVAARKCGRKAA